MIETIYIDDTTDDEEQKPINKPSKPKKRIKRNNSDAEKDELNLQAGLRASLLNESPSCTPPNNLMYSIFTGSPSGISRSEKARLEEQRVKNEMEVEEDETIVKRNISNSSTLDVSTSNTIGFIPSYLEGPKNKKPTPHPTTNRYFEGAVRNVYNEQHPSKTAMTFHDITGPLKDMTAAFVAGFDMNDKWVYKHFNDKVKLYICRSPGQGEIPGLSVFPGKERVGIFPDKRLEMGNMHIKLNVFVYPEFMRITIASANPINAEWKTLENTLYIHDFPLLSNPSKTENRTHNGFSRPIIKLMIELGTPWSFMKFFLLYDFSPSADSVKTVVTFSGYFDGWSEIHEGGGMAGLAKTDLGLGGRRYSIIEAASSSLRLYTKRWFSQFLAAASGIYPQHYARLEAARMLPTYLQIATIESKFKIVYPTRTETNNSLGGHGGGRCLWGNWENSYSGQAISKTRSFANIQSRFFKNQNQRKRILSHCKSLLAIDDTGTEGWAYVGSHNFTAAAWGQQNLTGIRSHNRNYELGVVFSIRASNQSEFDSIASTFVAYKRPLLQYGPDDEPWCSDRPEIDFLK